MKLATKIAAFALVLGTFSGPIPSLVIQDANASIFSSARGWKSVNLPEAAVNKVVGTRVEDVVKHLPTIAPGLDYISDKLEKRKKEYFSDNGKIEEILNIFFKKVPMWKGTTVKLTLTALVKYSEDNLAFKTIEVNYDRNDPKEFTVTPKSFVELYQTKLSFDVALKSRKVIVKDLNSDIKMIFPLGVGSFDEGVLNDSFSLLTPRFKSGFLDKSTTIKNRKKPRYFAGLPFIRILKGNSTSKDHTGIGFHAQPFPEKNKFIRAFDSHGCIRMQTPDLWSVYYMVTAGPTQQLPITVNYSSVDSSEHPFPKRNKPYKRVANYGSVQTPDFVLDRDNLVLVANNWEESAPIDKLFDLPSDNYHEVFNYSTSEHVAGKQEKIEKECRDKSYDSPKYNLDWINFAPKYSATDSVRKREKKLKKAKKKFESEKKKANKAASKIYKDCKDKYQRNNSFGDRVYRWWVH